MQKIRNTENVGTVHTQITFKKEKISLTRQDNKIFFGEMKTNIDHVAEIDSEKFKNIIRKYLYLY